MSKPTPKPKYCKDCKWCSGPYGIINRFLDGPDKDPYRHSLCLHPDLQRRRDKEREYLLSGFKPSGSPNFCSVNRISPCGSAGNHWEAK